MIRKASILVALLALGGTAWYCQRGFGSRSTEADMIIAGLGGFRGILAEVVWFRADRLQDEGRYSEMAQLANVLTSLEPYTPEVWAYAAWNLAYNISVMMPSDEDRWRWVVAAMRLLRDEGLRLNPGDPDLCRDLAWLFELKLGTSIDSAAETYRRLWREIITDVQARDAWTELRMEPAKMRAIEERTGLADWTDPCLSAVYWAAEGLPRATGTTRSMLEEIIRQSLVIYRKRQAS